MPFRAVDLTRVQTYPLPQRANRVALEDFITPQSPTRSFDNPELFEISERIAVARLNGAPVIWMIGGHVVKSGLSPILIALMEKGVITHLASNGAATIHDFEIGLQGHTSEDVAKSLENGTFGMAEETGAMMNQAIRQGARLGLGMGESLGKWITEDERFAHRDYSLLFMAYKLGIPYTVHVAIGTDIIHQHPLVDFAATGWATGQDFKIFTASVSELEGGVFCNFGSSVIGPEVFLKAVSISRNLGYPLKVLTTANFDLIPLEDYRKPVGDDNPEYYYRPRKNIVNRPVSLGGRGYHITGDHRHTIPNLYHQVIPLIGEANLPEPPNLRQPVPNQRAASIKALNEFSPKAASVLSGLIERQPALSSIAESMRQAFLILTRSFQAGGTLFLGGNGGSMADALHISAELNKPFKYPRPLPAALQKSIGREHDGKELAEHLQQGLRSMILGNNPSLASAIANDYKLANAGFAQELYSLARSGDVFLAISTSGNAQNILYATSLARALGLPVIALTGEKGGKLAPLADVAIRAPASHTDEIQNWHIQIYHALCEMLETHFFQEG